MVNKDELRAAIEGVEKTIRDSHKQLIDKIDGIASDWHQAMDWIKAEFQKSNDAVAALKDIVKAQVEDAIELSESVQAAKKMALLHQKALDSWDWEKRKKNLIVRGLPEGEMSIDGKDVKDDKSKVIEVLKKVGGNLEMVDDFFRLGKREEGRSRPLIVKFVRSREKYAIKENSKKLKEAGPMWAKVFIFNDEPFPYREEMKRLNIVFKAEKTNPDNAGKTVIFDRKKKEVSVNGVCVDRFANQNL